MNTFSDRLRYARTLKHMTQAELARAAGISQSAIASYESQHRGSSRAMFKLAAALNVDPEWLHTGRGSMSPSDPSVQARTPPVQSTLREPTTVRWPFTLVSPSQFQALSSDHKRLFESTAAGFVHACLRQYAEGALQKSREQKTHER